MSNQYKGAVSFEAEGKTYTLRYSVDAICTLEDAAGKGFGVIAAELADPNKLSLSSVRLVLWAGLQEHHPDIDKKAAGELIIAAGGGIKVIQLLERAFKASFPDAGGRSARPRKPGKSQRGTGPAS